MSALRAVLQAAEMEMRRKDADLGLVVETLEGALRAARNELALANYEGVASESRSSEGSANDSYGRTAAPSGLLVLERFEGKQ